MKVVLLTIAVLIASANAQMHPKADCGTCNDGRKVAGGTGCRCGLFNVAVAADKFCFQPTDGTGGTNGAGVQLTTVRCANTDGTVANTSGAVCSCGTNNIQIAVDKFCYEKANFEAHAQLDAAKTACTNQDGTAANSAACFCGDDAQAVDADHYCFKKPLDGNGIDCNGAKCPACTQTNGFTQNTETSSVCSCGSDGTTTADDHYCWVPAASSFPWNADGRGYSNAAKFCVDDNGALNTAGAAAVDGDCKCGKNATAVSDNQFCFVKPFDGNGLQTGAAQPACTATNGFTQTDGACACGSDGTATADDAYCWVPAASSFPWNASGKGYSNAAKFCVDDNGALNTAGAAAVDGNCKCGKNATAVSDNQFCFVKPLDGNGLQTAAAQPACTATNGFTQSSPACACGSDGTAVANNAYCWVPPTSGWNTTGLGFMHDTPFCRNSAGDALALDGNTGVKESCQCGKSDITVDTADHYCFVKGDGTGVDCNGTACPACTTTDGVSTGTACSCGNNGVAATASQYCWVPTESFNTAGNGYVNAAKFCAGTDGNTVATEACKCGTGATAVAEDKFCLQLGDGSGVQLDAALKPDSSCPPKISPAGAAAPGIFVALLAAVAVALRM